MPLTNNQTSIPIVFKYNKCIGGFTDLERCLL